MKRGILLALGLFCFWSAPAAAQTDFVNYLITVTGGKHDQHNLTVCVPMLVHQRYGKLTLARMEAPNYKPFGVGQLTPAGILNEGPVKENFVRRELHFVVPVLKAGQTLTFVCAVDNLSRPQSPKETFAWEDTKGQHADLIFARRPVMRYMYQGYDDSAPDKRNRTYKVFHHLFDPEGQKLVTNGGYTSDNVTDPKKLLYPHHRGVQYGFNKCLFGPDFKTRADTWHCQKDDHQAHEGFVQVEAGPFIGRHRVAIAWHGPGKVVFAKEERELTVYHLPGGTLLEFVSRLKPADGPVKLDGDPQHAGFQFRAHNDVAAKTAKRTYYLRPDGQGQPGQTRNWEPKSKKGPVDLPWNAMSFVLDDQRYTACYLNNPRNPGEQRYSERDYGRFGCYFVHDLTKEKPLVVNYRIWLQKGEMTADGARALSQAFIDPPKVAARVH